MQVSTIGLDLAKSVFHVVCFDQRFHEVSKRMLRRGEMLKYFARHPECVVAMEACANSNYWGRELGKLGHEVALIPAQHVKAYLRGNKNDYNDARAIAEASRRPGMRKVAVKTVEHQDIQALHRIRQQCHRDRTALINSTRGLLSEYGLALPKRDNVFRRRIPEVLADADNGLTDFFRALLAQRYAQFVALEEHIAFYTRKVEEHSKRDEACRRLKTIPGFGPVASSAFRNFAGNGRQFAKGRDVAAALGLVPGHRGTGGKTVHTGITKRGDGYVRSLLVHGARAIAGHAKRKDDPLSRWINRISEDRGFNKAVIAMANKMARMGWAVLRHETCYQAAT